MNSEWDTSLALEQANTRQFLYNSHTCVYQTKHFLLKSTAINLIHHHYFGNRFAYITDNLIKETLND